MARIMIGLDEAGMGTLAGPLTAAVVVLEEGALLPGVRDSKKMTDASREGVVDLIQRTAKFYRSGLIEADEIDRIGLGKAWNKLMRDLAQSAMKAFPRKEIIVDGNKFIPDCPTCVPIVKADDKYLCVSAASVLAKYLQCCVMDGFHQLYPKYGFNDHRGYGSPQHLKALEEHGPCQIHRKSYAPVKRATLAFAGSKPEPAHATKCQTCRHTK